MKNFLQRYSIWYKRHLQKPTRIFHTFHRLSLCRVAVGVVAPQISMYFSPRLKFQKNKKKKKKKGKKEIEKEREKEGKKLVRERVIQGRLRNGTRRYLF